MKITILTIFPEMFAPLHLSMLGRAEKAGLLDFYGREAEVESVKLRDVEILEIDTQEEKMYAILEEMEKQRMQLLPTDGAPGDGV